MPSMLTILSVAVASLSLSLFSGCDASNAAMEIHSGGRSLQDVDRIGAPVVTHQGFQLQMAFLVQDQVASNQIAIQLFRGGSCNLAVPSSVYGDYLTMDIVPGADGVDDGTKQFQLLLNFDPFQVPASRIYSSTTNSESSPNESGVLAFCVEFNIIDPATNLKESSFIQPMLVGINALGNDLGITGVIEDETGSFAVTAFECNEDNVMIPFDQSPVKSQGAKVRICVQPDELTYSSGDARMRSFYRLDIEKGGDDGAEESNNNYHNQQVVAPIGRISNLELTDIECTPGERMCVIITTLDNDFFNSEGIVRVIGTVYLQYSYGQARFLQSAQLPFRIPGGFAGQQSFVLSMKIAPSSKQYGVDAYICDGRNLRRQFAKIAPKKTGETVRICIEPNEEARANSVYVRSLSNFAFERKDNSRLRQMAIKEDGTRADSNDNLKTMFMCTQGDQICALKTRLNRDMFQSNGTVVMSGDVELQFGTSGRYASATSFRLLRNLQSDDLAFAGKPSSVMSFPVLQDPNYIGEDDWEDAVKDWWNDNPQGVKAIYIIALVLAILSCCCCMFFFCLQDLVQCGSRRRKQQNTAQGQNDAKSRGVEEMSIDPNQIRFRDVLGPPTVAGSQRTSLSSKMDRSDMSASMHSYKSNASRRTSTERGGYNPTSPRHSSSGSRTNRGMHSPSPSVASSKMPGASYHSRMSTSSNHSRTSNSSSHSSPSKQRRSHHQQSPNPSQSAHYSKSPYHRASGDESVGSESMISQGGFSRQGRHANVATESPMSARSRRSSASTSGSRTPSSASSKKKKSRPSNETSSHASATLPPMLPFRDDDTMGSSQAK